MILIRIYFPVIKVQALKRTVQHLIKNSSSIALFSVQLFLFDLVSVPSIDLEHKKGPAQATRSLKITTGREGGFEPTVPCGTLDFE